MFAFEFALSALRRAGFFRGFLLGVTLGGWTLAAVAAISVGAAMSIYLRDSAFLSQESVGPVHNNEPLRLSAMHTVWVQTLSVLASRRWDKQYGP